MFNCDNLHQISISCNEDTHAAIRSKISILQSSMKFYRLRRQYNESWIRYLQVNSAIAKNRVSLNLQNVSKLHNLMSKVSGFALTEIK